MSASALRMYARKSSTSNAANRPDVSSCGQQTRKSRCATSVMSRARSDKLSCPSVGEDPKCLAQTRSPVQGRDDRLGQFLREFGSRLTGTSTRSTQSNDGMGASYRTGHRFLASGHALHAHERGRVRGSSTVSPCPPLPSCARGYVHGSICTHVVDRNDVLVRTNESWTGGANVTSVFKMRHGMDHLPGNPDHRRRVSAESPEPRCAVNLSARLSVWGLVGPVSLGVRLVKLLTSTGPSVGRQPQPGKKAQPLGRSPFVAGKDDSIASHLNLSFWSAARDHLQHLASPSTESLPVPCLLLILAMIY